MIRILFVDHTPMAGGAQLALPGHIRHLDRSRFSALVACTPQVPLLVEQYREAGAHVHFVPLDQLKVANLVAVSRAFRSAWALRRLVRKQQVDVVVANTSRAAYVASLAMAGTGLPLIWWVRDFLYGRRLFRLLRGVPDKIICVSRAVRNFYGGDHDSKFATVYVSSELYKHRVPLDDLVNARTAWGLQPTDMVVGFMGRLVRDKGPEDLVDAVMMLHREFPKLKLLLVGTGREQEGDVEPELRRIVHERGLDYVVMTGYQTNEALCYALFDVFVLCTREDDAFATSLVQAMMAGKPVVATSTGGTPEIVFDGETGLLVPPADPPALAAAIRSLLDDEELADRLASAGQQHALRNYRQDVITRQIEQIYFECARRTTVGK